MKTTENARWQAVLRRQPAPGFVYAVATTGVYCRPGCPSRRPRRRNVRFFDSADSARRAGYRACLRCGRDRMAGLGRWLLAHPEEGTSLAALARRVGLSAAHLQRAFTRATGVSPRAFVRACRLSRFRRALKEGRVLDALARAGFGSTSRGHGVLGMSPGAYRAGAEGVEIRWTAAASPLGRLQVAATARGLCSVSLGGRVADLAREFPKARLRRDDGRLRAALAALLRHLDGRQPRLDLPTDVRATAFQARVWEALRGIPYGRTRTYAQVARALGRPRSARAVARAVASNPLALVVPCHRVVRADGAAGGYRWGVARKADLLRRERGG